MSGTLDKEFEVIQANHNYVQSLQAKADLLEILLRDSRHSYTTFQDGCRVVEIVNKYPDLEYFCEQSAFAMRYLNSSKNRL